MMNRFFTLLLAASCLTAVGQVTYPYNPDEDGNGQIAVGDLQGILSTYGNAFSPSEILVDGETLTTVLTQLQNSIDSLSGLTGGGGSVLDMPLGTVLPIATESVPEGWMLCDGREISIEEYQGLYDLIGTTYGAGDSAFWAQVFYPATTFNIPDLRGRTIIGANDMGGEQSDVLAIHSASVGEVGGEEMHQLAEVEMPIHTHAPEGSLVSSFVYGAVENGNGNNRVFVSELTLGDGQAPSGGDQPHNNMQPYMALNHMIKVQAAEDVVTMLESEVQDLAIILDSALSASALPALGSNYGGGIVVHADVITRQALIWAPEPFGYTVNFAINDVLTAPTHPNPYLDWRLPSISEVQAILAPNFEIYIENGGYQSLLYGAKFWTRSNGNTVELSPQYDELSMLVGAEVIIIPQQSGNIPTYSYVLPVRVVNF